MKMKKLATIPPLSRKPTFREYLAHHIGRSGLSNREIAAACGFGQPNMVSMIKLGHTRLPLDRIPAMADVLELDVMDLFGRWMREHYPETWEVLFEAGLPTPFISR